MAEDSGRIIRVVHVDDKNPLLSSAFARLIFRGRPRGLEVTRFSVSGNTVEFSPATGLETFLAILERFAKIREDLGKVIVITDGTMPPTGNDPVGCHGLDLIKITAARVFGREIPPKLRDLEGTFEKITGATVTSELTERIMGIPPEVYKSLQYLMISGDTGDKFQADYNQLYQQAPAGMMWHQPMRKPFERESIRVALKTIMGITLPG